MNIGDRVKVVRIVPVGRWAGNATVKKPPNRLRGKVGTVRRCLISWGGVWVSFGRGKRVENLRCGGRMTFRTKYPDEYIFDRAELTLVRKAAM